jgi:hypothetical protein
MAIDLPPDRDLTLIFERDDVRAAFASHCVNQHTDDNVGTCKNCHSLIIMLAVAIDEWKAICDLERINEAH